MSFYYLSPVKGEMPVHLLETIILKRLEYLTAIAKSETTGFNEFVIEGSVYDNVGHFMLCIITNLYQNRDFTKFFLKAETALFRNRLKSLSAYELRSFAKKIMQNLKKYDFLYNPALKLICQHLILKHVSHHLCSEDHEESCGMFNIELNFHHCLPLVASRQVELQHGVATVPCGRWKTLLIIQFQKRLLQRILNKDIPHLRNDPRILEILQKIKNENFNFTSSASQNTLTSKDVDKTSIMFPPCMLNLHLNLRKRHRLSHDQRFYFSLFLKDIGMPVEEAIEFWRQEYRKDPSGGSCCHHWERDEKKFIYGIRHMYGLEGARKEYSSVSCHRIQTNSNAGCEGGCPFKSFDPPIMAKLLDTKALDTPGFLTEIHDFKRKGDHISSCLHYLKNRFTKSVKICDNNVSLNFTPVKYYELANKYK
ncbi:probable DNA primase large subunit [Plutella xylostella]|uniref:probable DNA primase large subunit n=1 Tax=Plutella xylostella TaxID=51655 RepID=UPI0020329CD8|nr:probable DNA primase large subunit [Plutella xylostella]